MYWILFAPFLLFASISSDLAVGLRALQQIRTLIPERLSDEEFSILVDRNAFSGPIEKLASNALKEPGIPSSRMLNASHFYYLRWTISGEPVRILDAYQDFEYGPYWRYPTSVHCLYDMHHAAISGSK